MCRIYFCIYNSYRFPNHELRTTHYVMPHVVPLTSHAQVQTYLTKKWFYAEYAMFSLDPEVNWYTIHLSGYSGDAGDSLSNTTLEPLWNQNGRNFTTPDADNDQKSDGNCALMFSGMWWFNNCWWSCLTCPFRTKFFSWWTLDDYGLQKNGRLLAARMMISTN